MPRCGLVLRSPRPGGCDQVGLCEVISCTRVRGYLELILPIRCTRENATASKNDSLPNGFADCWDKSDEHSLSLSERKLPVTST
jgi:hypothetical protein